MRAAFARRGHTMYELLSKIDGVSVLAPQGAFYCFPSFAGCSDGRSPGGRPGRRSSCARSCSTWRRWRSFPGEAFGAPGYARLSFALGDDDLGEGVRRIAELFDVGAA